MNNQISGDFDSETLEAFRNLYAQREVKPEELEVDKYTGLPTDVVTNVSPWIEHTGLWRANPGTERDFVPNQVLDGSLEQNFEDIRDFDGLSSEELDALVENVISEIEEEEAFADRIFNSSDDDDDEGVYRGEVDDEGGMTDDELERILASILEEEENEEEERIAEREALEVDEEEPMSDDDLDRLIDELLAETGEEVAEDEEEDDGYSDADLEALIKELLTDSDDSDDDSEGIGDSLEIGYEEEAGEDSDEGPTEEPYSEDDEEPQGEDDEMSEAEIDNLIDQIMAEIDEDLDED
jgi:hypothetical protein